MTKHKSITCPRCGMTSCNPNDISKGYCGFCHAFHEPEAAMPPVYDLSEAAARRLFELRSEMDEILITREAPLVENKRCAELMALSSVLAATIAAEVMADIDLLLGQERHDNYYWVAATAAAMASALVVLGDVRKNFEEVHSIACALGRLMTRNPRPDPNAAVLSLLNLNPNNP